MEEDEGESPLVHTDAEMRELLGLFEVPAFARRGFDLEYALKRLHERLARDRSLMLDMVRLRLKQWASVTCGTLDYAPFAGPIENLYQAIEAEPPRWAAKPGTARARMRIGQDLVASLDRFHRRWQKHLADLDLTALNRLIDRYNRYYLLEKECSLGSSRLAARFFIPQTPRSVESLLAEYPLLPIPTMAR